MLYTMGLPNYEGFIENRHDQTIWSLLTKKHGILSFRDPSQYGDGAKEKEYSDDVRIRSRYPMIIDSHRNGQLATWNQYVFYRKISSHVYRYYKGAKRTLKSIFCLSK